MSTPKPPDFKPVPTFPKGHHFYGRARCQAWNPAKGRQCMGLAMVSVGVDKCKGCGGKSRRGIESPSYKHGRYSQYLPDRLREKYEQLGEDQNLMEMRPRVRLLETRLLEVTHNLDSEGSFAIFELLKNEMEEYEKYMVLGRTATKDKQREYSRKASQALTEIFRLINRGVDEKENWDEIQEITEQIRKLADTEQRQIRTAETAVLVDRVLVFASVMGSIFREIVMNVSSLPVQDRKQILADTEREVNMLLRRGEYEVIDG